MKKNEYFAPEMEILELRNTAAILAGSGEIAPGTGDSEEL